MTWRTNPGALRVRTRDGDTVAADELAGAVAKLAAAVAARDALDGTTKWPALVPAFDGVTEAARDVARLAAAFGVIEAGPGIAWARRLLAELRDDGVKPSTLRELEAALPVWPGAAVLVKAHREAVGDGLTAATVAELAALALGGDL
jgi:hypothetical protein